MALRATVYDHFIWTLICPFIAGFILFQIKLKSFLVNKLDRLIIYYLCYGVLLLLIGILVSPTNVNVIRNFIHMYMPALAYIIARYYCGYSPSNILRIFSMLVFLSIFIIMDIFIEYIIIENYSASYIPWVNLGMEKVARFRMSLESYGNIVTPGSFLSVMGGSKTVALLISSLFCTLTPFLINKPLTSKSVFPIFNNSLLIIIMIWLLIISFMLPSLASTLSLLFVFVLIILQETKLNDFKPIIFLLVFVLLIVFFFKDFFIEQYIRRTRLFVGQSTEIEYIFNILNSFTYYSDAGILAYVFGGDMFPSSLPAGHTSELTMLLMPLRYSILWALLIGMILLTIVKYFRFLINRFPRNNINRTLGLAFMGFFIVYITNLHYPSFNLHGNIELFFIMAAALSSSYEYACKEIYYSSNKYHI